MRGRATARREDPTAAVLYRRANGSAGLTGYERVPVAPIFEHVSVPTFMALLGEANRGHDYQGYDHTHGYEVMRHGATPR